MPNDEHAIVVDKLSKRYGALLAVDDISFTVQKGEVFAFLGPNGAGKSVTVEVIETIRKPTSGKVTVLGLDVGKRKSEIVRRIGVLPQNFSSFDRITVRESLRYYARVFGCKVDIDALMDLTHLRDKADAQFNTLSGGLKQRLGIAAALVNDPEVVFLDEPTTGLDPYARRQVWDVLKGLKNRGKTVFLTTHYMEEAELLADTVAIISRGKIVAIDSPTRLTEKHAKQTRLTLESIDPAALGLIQELGFVPTPNGDGNVSVPVKNADDVRTILEEIQRAGLALSGLDVRKPNLEEVFLKLTGPPRDDRAGGGAG
ncbi:MAG: ATP-binding cassette domain-containing protein [Actinomycetota bacterium]